MYIMTFQIILLCHNVVAFKTWHISMEETLYCQKCGDPSALHYIFNITGLCFIVLVFATLWLIMKFSEPMDGKCTATSLHQPILGKGSSTAAWDTLITDANRFVSRNTAWTLCGCNFVSISVAEHIAADFRSRSVFWWSHCGWQICPGMQLTRMPLFMAAVMARESFNKILLPDMHVWRIVR